MDLKQESVPSPSSTPGSARQLESSPGTERSHRPSGLVGPALQEESPSVEHSVRPRNLAGPPVPPFRNFPVAPVPPTQPCGLRPAIRRRAPSLPLPRLRLAPQPPPPDEDDDIHGSHVRTVQRLRNLGWNRVYMGTPEMRTPGEARSAIPPLRLPQPVAPTEPRPARRPRAHSRSSTNTPVAMDPPRAATTTPQPSFLEPAWQGLPRAPIAPRAPSAAGRSWRRRRLSFEIDNEKTETKQNVVDIETQDGKCATDVAEERQQTSKSFDVKGEPILEKSAEDDHEAQKRHAVLTLQKFFFDEIARGGSPNGSAARALLRLNADAAPIEEEASESRPSTETPGVPEEEEANAQSIHAVPSPGVPLRPSPAFRGPQGRNAIRVSNYV